MKRRHLQISGLIILIFSLCFFAGCEYKFTEFDRPDEGEIISFSEDIIPILNSDNNCSSCHAGGTQYADFTPENAYDAIVPDLVNVSNPEDSKIYAVPMPGSKGHTFSKYDALQAFLVLEWIRQGALNN